MNEKKNPVKRKFARVAVIVACVCALFMMCTFPISASQTTQPPTSNVLNGEQSYAFVPIKTLKYITASSSGNFYWKDIPITNTFPTLGWWNFTGLGNPLDPTINKTQIIYSGEVETGIFNPIYAGYDRLSNVTNLPDAYAEYFHDGQCDIMMYQITCNNSEYLNPNGYTLTYQCLDMSLNDYYIEGANINMLQVLTPSVTLYKPMTASDLNGMVYITGTVEYYNTTTGANESIFIECRLDFVYPPTTTNSLHMYNVVPMHYLVNDAKRMDNGRFAEAIDNADFVAIRDVNIRCGDIPEAMNKLYGGDMSGTMSACLVRVPSLRPYYTGYTDATTADQNRATDINYKLKDELINVTVHEVIKEVEVEKPVVMTNLSDFIANIATNTLGITIAEGVTLGGILFAFIAVALTIAVLKYFAGG